MMRCETCKAWDRMDRAPNDLHRMTTKARMCHLLPIVVPKEPDDWCMQHKMIGEAGP